MMQLPSITVSFNESSDEPEASPVKPYLTGSCWPPKAKDLQLVELGTTDATDTHLDSLVQDQSPLPDGASNVAAHSPPRDVADKDHSPLVVTALPSRLQISASALPDEDLDRLLHSLVLIGAAGGASSGRHTSSSNSSSSVDDGDCGQGMPVSPACGGGRHTTRSSKAHLDMRHDDGPFFNPLSVTTMPTSPLPAAEQQPLLLCNSSVCSAGGCTSSMDVMPLNAAAKDDTLLWLSLCCPAPVAVDLRDQVRSCAQDGRRCAPGTAAASRGNNSPLQQQQQGQREQNTHDVHQEDGASSRRSSSSSDDDHDWLDCRQARLKYI